MKKKLRRLKYLMRKYNIVCFNSVNTIREIVRNSTEKNNLRDREKGYAEILGLAKKLDMDDITLKFFWLRYSEDKHKFSFEHNKMPKATNRDNGDTYNWGSGCGNRNSIRYPSKERSKRVWKKFYKLFPSRAEIDGWDGTTSKRMK